MLCQSVGIAFLGGQFDVVSDAAHPLETVTAAGPARGVAQADQGFEIPDMQGVAHPLEIISGHGKKSIQQLFQIGRYPLDLRMGRHEDILGAALCTWLNT